MEHKTVCAFKKGLSEKATSEKHRTENRKNQKRGDGIDAVPKAFIHKLSVRRFAEAARITTPPVQRSKYLKNILP